MKYSHVKVPLIMQMEYVECGAASLAMILACYGKYVPLEQVRRDCGVSRDGARASNLVTAAENFSGGQRQRITIACTLAKNPKVLILDEATSALDNVTQKKVTEALGNLHCTRIVIAHRLSTIRDCDRILVLNKGRITEEGSYDELLKKGGEFAELAQYQLL